MWPYWLIFLIPAGAAIAYGWQSPSTRLHRSLFKFDAGWLFLIVVLSLFIGLRHQVGGDWGAYLRHLDSQIGRGISDVLAGGDPGYYLLNWLAVHGGGNIYVVNLVCGLIGAVGLVALSRTQPRPLLAIAIATPYLVNIVMMGYTRQGAAIGLGMLGLAALVKARNRQFVFWVLAAITFHKSAIVLLPLAILGRRKNRWLTGLAAIVITAMAYHFFLADYLSSLYAGYIRAEYNSAGALVRLSMNALPALILLIWGRRFTLLPHERRIWRWFAIAAIGLLLAYPLVPSSTALDRIGLFLIPLQLVVFSHLPDAIGKTGKSNRDWVVVILAYYATVQFVWLNYAHHASAWLPYQLYPLSTL